MLTMPALPNVEAAQILDGLRHRGANVGGVAYVERYRQAAPSQPFNSLGGVA